MEQSIHFYYMTILSQLKYTMSSVNKMLLQALKNKLAFCFHFQNIEDGTFHFTSYQMT